MLISKEYNIIFCRTTGCCNPNQIKYSFHFQKLGFVNCHEYMSDKEKRNLSDANYENKSVSNKKYFKQKMLLNS